MSVTADHELFEMVIDPIANLWAEATDGTEYAYEMCDPVEEDTFLVDGIRDVEFRCIRHGSSRSGIRLTRSSIISGC